jgi:hypothetical protein
MHQAAHRHGEKRNHERFSETDCDAHGDLLQRCWPGLNGKVRRYVNPQSQKMDAAIFLMDKCIVEVIAPQAGAACPLRSHVDQINLTETRN